MIDQLREEYPVRQLCAVLDCSPSTYDYPSQAMSDENLITAIEDILMRWPFYGYRRVLKQRQRQGWLVGETRARRVLKEMGHTVKVGRVRMRTTASSHPHWRYPNLLKHVTPKYPDHVWVADITYVRLREEFVFLAVVLDAYSRRLIGWELDRTLEASLTLAALRMALSRRTVSPGLVHHSDRGVQYASRDYTDLLKSHGVQISMSRKGNPWDNAACESFLKTLKYEEVYRSEYRDLAEARASIRQFLEQVYNRKRLHSGLGYVPPVEFEAHLAAKRNEEAATRRLGS